MPDQDPANTSITQHLAAWRAFRGLSQEEVGYRMGKRHTTIGRWEASKMRISTADLEALATIYLATPAQLQAPPEARLLVERLGQIQQEISELSESSFEKLLSMARFLLQDQK